MSEEQKGPFRSIPKGAVEINEKELERVIIESIDSLPKEGGNINVTIEEIESNLYEMVITRLRSKRLFYPGLNPGVLSKLFKQISSGFSFKTSVLTKKDTWDEYDRLVWNKVNEMPYNQSRLEALKRVLKIE